MNRCTLLLAPFALAAFAAPGLAQSQVKAVAVDPVDSARVWTLNRDNNSVALVDTTSGTLLSEITVGVWPRSLAFTPDGAHLLVVNQRGNVPIETNFVTPFNGSEVRGSISVIDTATKTVVDTLVDVGTEPYGITLAPNGKYFLVSAQRSGEMIVLDSTTFAEITRLAYDWDLNFIAPGKTVADLDEDLDGIPDLGTPRGFSITADSTQAFVTHLRSPWISVLDITLDGAGVPTAIALDSKIQQDDYPFHPLNNPVPVQIIKSQGTPRFSTDVALSPDGRLAVVPQQLANANHDVGHDFGPGLDGDFANRIYPSLTILDVQNKSFGQPGDKSGRLHHELADTDTPAEYVPLGVNQNGRTTTGIATLGGVGNPVLGGTARLRVTGASPSATVVAWFGDVLPAPFTAPGVMDGSQLIGFTGPITLTGLGDGVRGGNFPIGTAPVLAGTVVNVQAAIIEPGQPIALTNALQVVLGTEGYETGKMGRRAGLPSKALFNSTGDRVLMLNRGSEDVFLFERRAGGLRLMSVFPPRYDFEERAGLDTTTPMGDLPLGWVMQPDASTTNDDALLYIQNEVTRTLSVIRVDFRTGVMTKERSQIATHTGPDLKTLSERKGQEIFEDASRPQTTGKFNNSCASCHYEGGEDGIVWQRLDGPRSTMPVYGGPLATGLLLWKGTRINFGETGPMFGGENGGHGIFTDAEQMNLNDYHHVIPVPLNPHIDATTGDLTADAAIGRDLFFGSNDTGTNPLGRTAGCATCHPDQSGASDVRGYTADFLNPQLTDTLDFGFVVDNNCFSLRENIVSLNVRNINSGVNVDENDDMVPDNDRNLDGYSDLEGYTPLYPDTASDFTRDDPNSYPCLEDPFDPQSPLRVFARGDQLFSIPTKLGASSTGPYMHDHSLISMRHIIDPESQMFDAQYGDAGYPTTFKWYNEFHDLRGHEDIVTNISKVKLGLQSTDVDDDIEKILAFITSL
ncbi:Lactonase, 7-bladed beta-propeller [Planctomycetes bacterium Pla163]|uniref:Lactonase, 7-bladed beta-propeller n=1 Tax=Rohdeia mirabilis TaxID=2528008 RepID=A0A518D512_9BACT|nr:Lactonase, 7-bladed beta-propeller [Planctomycetes bacterium Pla163]